MGSPNCFSLRPNLTYLRAVATCWLWNEQNSYILYALCDVVNVSVSLAVPLGRGPDFGVNNKVFPVAFKTANWKTFSKRCLGKFATQRKQLLWYLTTKTTSLILHNSNKISGTHFGNRCSIATMSFPRISDNSNLSSAYGKANKMAVLSYY